MVGWGEMKIKVIHHSADYDGLFCREIARKFLPEAELIGWDFGDAPLEIPNSRLYVLDLPLDAPFGFDYRKTGNGRAPQHPAGLVWIDHHKSAIESHPQDIPGYRIDGVAACRLAWQWFSTNSVPQDQELPRKEKFVEREVDEPLSVRLAGEYDIWDHRGDGDLEFQFGLDAQERIPWGQILESGWGAGNITNAIVADGRAAMRCYAKRDADIMHSRSFMVQWEGLTFLALNTARCNSNTFAARDVPETGHDALMAFFYNGEGWTFSLYHAAHRKDIDLSKIAVHYGGGGHRGACGFRCAELPF